MGARIGEAETVTVEDLLCCLLMENANDAAVVLAEKVAGINLADTVDGSCPNCYFRGAMSCHEGEDADCEECWNSPYNGEELIYRWND